MSHETYLQLVKLLSMLAHSYYVNGEEIIPNHEYDARYRMLEQYEEDHPDMISKDSPTQRTGAFVPQGEIFHKPPMLSLKNALTLEALQDTIASWQEELNDQDLDLIVELKYDGCAAKLKYTGGMLIEAATRGDGEVGENILHNVLRTPIARNICHPDDDLEIRGELMIHLDDLPLINGSLAVGEKAYQNTRNAIAGMMRRLSLPLDLAKYVRFYPYDILGDDFNDLDREKKLMNLHMAYGSSSHDLMYIKKKPEEVFMFIEKIRGIIPTLPFEIDGLVIKINRQDYCNRLGTRLKSPRWAIAYKFPPEEVETMLLNAVWQVGRTGEVAPVARVAPVLIGGTIVSGPTMHNIDVIKANDWRIGDTVRVYRAGAVVPALGSVVLSKRPENSVPLEAITHCPCCNSELVKVGPSLFCLNRANCIDQLVFEYDYIFSRKVLDVSDISDKTIRSILTLGKVQCVADFFELTVDDIGRIPGITVSGAAKLVKSFRNAAQAQPLNRVIQALCIPDVGEATAKSIALALGTLENFFAATPEQLLAIDDVGEATVANITTCFEDEQWMANAKKLSSKLNILSIEVAKVIMKQDVTDKTFVITGSFPQTRDEMRATLEVFGATVRDSVSKNTDYIVVGDSPSTDKVAKAATIKHVRVLSFDDYQKLLA